MSIERVYNFIKSKVDNKVLREKAKKITDKLADSYIISYPKSGRTWTSTLLAYYISKDKGSPIKKFRFNWNPFLHSFLKNTLM
jgi:hypothetical protein